MSRTRASLLFVGAVAAALIAIFEPTLRLPAGLPRVAGWCSLQLGRTVHLESVQLRLSWPPALLLGAVRVEGLNDRDLIRARTVTLTPSPSHALRGHLVLRELEAEELALDLAEHEDGSASWDSVHERGPGETREPLRIERVRLRALSILLRDERNDRSTRIELDSLAGGIQPSARVAWRGRGHTRAGPFDLEVRTGPLADLLGPGPWPLTFTARDGEDMLSGDTELATSGSGSARPPGTRLRLGRVELASRGSSFAALGARIGVPLPALGPYVARATLTGVASAQPSAALTVQSGGATVTGTVRLDTGPDRSRVAVDLTANGIDLEELLRGVRSAPLPVRPPTPNRPTLPIVGTLVFSAEPLRWNGEDLGKASLRARFESGALTLETATIEAEGSRLSVGGSLSAAPGSVRATLRAQSDSFDYGPWLRALGAGEDMSGVASLDIALESEAGTATGLSSRANGHIDIALYPFDLDAGRLDLWTANLLFELLPIIDSGKDSRLVCAVGLFDVRGGVLQERALLFDTTQMTVYGDATIDLERRWMKGKFEPRPKKPRLFSISPRVRVRGPFADLQIRVKPRKMSTAIARFAVSPVLVPIERLLRSSGPTRPDACLAAIATSGRALSAGGS